MGTVDFQPGDRAVIARPSAYPEYEGARGVVLASPKYFKTRKGNMLYGYLIQIDGFEQVMGATDQELEPEVDS